MRFLSRLLAFSLLVFLIFMTTSPFLVLLLARCRLGLSGRVRSGSSSDSGLRGDEDSGLCGDEDSGLRGDEDSEQCGDEEGSSSSSRYSFFTCTIL